MPDNWRDKILRNGIQPSVRKCALMSDEIVTVATCQSLPEAEACRLGLESKGLNVVLTDAETIRTDWLLSNAVGSIKVQVPQSQVEAAEAVMQQFRQQKREQAQHPDEDFCLSCGLAMPKNVSTCEACGWSYASDLEADNLESE
jgi:hypothetical protein